MIEFPLKTENGKRKTKAGWVIGRVEYVESEKKEEGWSYLYVGDFG